MVKEGKKHRNELEKAREKTAREKINKGKTGFFAAVCNKTKVFLI